MKKSNNKGEKMKTLLVMSIALSSFSAFADWSLKNEKELNDLMYLPQAKTIFGTSSIDFKSYEAELNYNSQLYKKVKADSTEIVQSAGYALTDNFTLGLKVAQLLSQKDTYTDGPASTTPNTTADFKKSGFEDPYIMMKYRALSQTDSSFNGDLLLSISPGLGDQKDSSKTIKGNAYRGGSLISFGGEIGKKYTDMGWKVALGLDFYGKKKSKDATNANEITETDSKTDINVGFAWQWVVNPTFTVNLNTGVSFTAEETATDKVGDSKTVVDSSNSFLIGTDLIFNLSKKFAIDLGLNGRAYSEAGLKVTTISSGSVTSLTAKNYTEGLFSIAAKYEF